MAQAIPMAVGVVAGSAAYMTGAATTAMMAINIGMMAMSVTQMIMGMIKGGDKRTNSEYAVVNFTAKTSSTGLPRVYGTARLPANLTWFGNYGYLDTSKSKSESRYY